MYLKLHALRTHAHIYTYTHTYTYMRDSHKMEDNRKKDSTLDWVRANRDFFESTVFATSMSRRVVLTCHGNWPNPTSLLFCFSSFLSLFFLFLTSSIPLLSGFFPPFEILTLVHFLVGDPCSFSPFRSLFFSLYIARYVFLAIHRFSFLLSSLSVAKGNYSTLLPFLFFVSFFTISRGILFSPFARFQVRFYIFLYLVSFSISFCPFFHFSTTSVASFTSLTFFSRPFPLIFSSHLPFSASFESAFLRALFTSLALFHASFHPPSASSSTSFYPRFFFLRPPSLIPLAALPSSIYFDRS